MTKSGVTLTREDPLKVERAFLVGVHLPETSGETAEDLLEELAELTDTLGVPVVGRRLVRVRKPASRYLVGSGQAETIAAEAEACRADVVVFDDALSPSQQRNWEELTGKAVIDRQEVILDIFAEHATTREAVLQVALARATYALPRLKRRWTHLSRQRGATGGMGLRGEGEQQIEVDSRLVRARIARLKRQLKEVQRHRETQRVRRLRKPVPVAAIVGYTNAGKSSLLNRLTDADVLVQDKLFATLDPTVRRLELPNRQVILLADTVGFIRRLPHLLVEAFKSTLEEALVADFLLEVVDVTWPDIEQHRQTALAVLEELGGDVNRILPVFNKIDRADDPHLLRRLRRRYPHAVFVSARTGEGLDLLRQRLAEALQERLSRMDLLVPHERYDVVARIHRTSHVLCETHEPDGTHIAATVPPEIRSELTAFLCPKIAGGD